MRSVNFMVFRVAVCYTCTLTQVPGHAATCCDRALLKLGILQMAICWDIGQLDAGILSQC